MLLLQLLPFLFASAILDSCVQHSQLLDDVRDGHLFQKVFVAVCTHPLLPACRVAAKNFGEVGEEVVENDRA